MDFFSAICKENTEGFKKERRKSHLMAAETEQMLCRKEEGKGELRTGKISPPKELKSSVC